MEMQSLLQIIGLLLNILGLVLIFTYGISPFLKAGSSGHQYFYSNEQELKQSPLQKQKKRWFLLSLIGLLLSVSGNLLQISAFFV